MAEELTYPIKQSPLKRLGWQNIIVYSVIICSCFPKIVLTEGINIFFPELILFIGLILGVKQFITFPEQRFLLGIFFFMLIFSLVAQFSVLDIGAILRSFKELLYVPIIYWASTIKDKQRVLKHIVLFGCIAYSINLMIYLQNFSSDNTIWSDADTLSSGMSNRGFDLLSFKFVQLSGLAHGIWGSYCVLIFILALSLKNRNIISRSQLFIVGTLFFINLVVTISRETILVLLVISVIAFFRSKISVLKRMLILSSLVLVVIAIGILGSNLPVVQKLSYTYDALSENGSEGNFNLRVNTWLAYFNFLAHHIEYLFMGLGLSPINFYNHIVQYTHEEIVDVPESAMVYTQAYGGFFAFMCLISLIVTAAIKIAKNCPYKLIKYFFIGIIITNIMSSVSMFSDLLYAHLCLIYGLLIVKNNEFKSDAVISES